MPHDHLELLAFRRFRDLNGTVHDVSIGRRNGKPSAFLIPNSLDLDPPSQAPGFEEDERLFVNLNPVERDTWRRILAAQSIASIADEDRVSRPAIYARILGNSKGQGGMIAKNFWVLLWWRLRQRLLSNQIYV